MKKAVLIYNPAAGGKPARREGQILQVAAALGAAGFAARLAPTSAPGTASGLARAAVTEGTKHVFACGGDGTINEVINGMTPGDATLGILPGGTANIFARELALPLDPLRAARACAQWTPRHIALGRATWNSGENPAGPSSRFFLSLAGVGVDAYVIHKLSRELAGRFGVFAYAWEAIRQLFRYSFPPMIWRVDGREMRSTFAAVQRTERYAGWLHLAPKASVHKDQFTLCAFKSSNRWRYFWYSLAVVMRSHWRLSDVELLPAVKAECWAAEKSARILFELDGELAGAAPVTFDIVPNALAVLMP